jgi:hypothetical protein
MSTEWVAYLSDGRSINEKDLFVQDEELPFKKLVKHCVKNNLTITAITATVNGVRYNTPSTGTRGNFNSTVKPEKFWVQYRERFLPLQGLAISFIGLSWKTRDIRTTLWIKTGDIEPISWIEIRGAGGSTEEYIDKFYEEAPTGLGDLCEP